jgi:hypothetical protein
MKHLSEFLEANTSIKTGNNNEFDNDVKKNTINEEADKSNSE